MIPEGISVVCAAFAISVVLQLKRYKELKSFAEDLSKVGENPRGEQAKPAALVVRKWVGFHLNGHGEPDCHLVDHNPGYLAHTFQIEIQVPPEVAEHLTRKLDCVLLDKQGKPVGNCTNNETSET